MLCHAILRALNVRCYTVFDGDAGMEERKREGLQPNLEDKELADALRKIDGAVRRSMLDNTNLLGYLGGTPTGTPADESTREYTIFHDHLEGHLTSHWPAWVERQREMVRDGDGFAGKNAATYREAARTTTSEPPLLLQSLLQNVLALAG